VLVVGGGTGTAMIYADSVNEAPAFGYLSEGVRVRVNGPPANGRLPVRVGGQMIVDGYVPLSRLVAFVNQRGRIDGTPAYLGTNDPVSLVSQSSDGSFRVEIHPSLGRAGVADLGPFVGSVPADWLVDHTDGSADSGLTAGEFRRLPAGTEVPVYDRPSGQVIARLPALDPPLTVVVIRSQSGWNGVRVGVGPFLVGYIQGDLEASTAEALGTRIAPAATALADGQMPQRIAIEEGALFRVAAGTWVQFCDNAGRCANIARPRVDAWARELSRDPHAPDEVDVYLAVDQSVAVRGVVPESAMTRVTEGQ
jgi:hypothetical protein